MWKVCVTSMYAILLNFAGIIIRYPDFAFKFSFFLVTFQSFNIQNSLYHRD
jgi:hypothetical protein